MKIFAHSSSVIHRKYWDLSTQLAAEQFQQFALEQSLGVFLGLPTALLDF